MIMESILCRRVVARGGHIADDQRAAERSDLRPAHREVSEESARTGITICSAGVEHDQLSVGQGGTHVEAVPADRERTENPA